MNVRMNKLLIVTLLTILAVLSLPMQAFAAASGTHTPVEGITVGVSGATDNSMSNGAVTVTAKGSSGFLGIGASAKTATITITNGKSKKATISFDWTATSVNELKIDGTVYSGDANSFSKQLPSGESFTITITTAKNGTTNKLVMSNFAIAEVKDSSNVTIQFNQGYPAKVDGTAVTVGTVVTVPESGATLTAETSNFVAWINDADNTVLSKETEFTLQPTGDMTVKAINTTNACFEVGNKLFETLTEAITAATNGTVKTIVLANNGTLPADDYTIPSGVTLLIPFNDSYDVYTDATAYAGETMVTPTAYRTLTLAEGTSIIVNGSMNVAGKFAYTNSGGQSGSPSGPLGFVKMEADSNITVNGKLYAYGYIIGDGTVTANNGATVYEVLQMPEFRGGDQSTSMEHKVFPLSQFYVQNIEVPMTIYQGATEETFASVYIYGGGLINSYFPTGIKLFGSGGMFELGSANQYITKWYDGSTDRLHIKINGDVSMNSIELLMNVGLLGSQSINSKNFVLPINGGFTIHIESGSLTIPNTQEVLLQPGAQIIIDSGATVTVNSKLYIYDAAQWGAYCIWGHAGAGDANGWDTPSIPVSYSPTRTKVRMHVLPRTLFKDGAGNPIYITEDENIYEAIFGKNAGDLIAEADLAEYLTLLPDASIQVDGTLSGNIYTTAGGANIFSTGTGTFTQTATANASVFQLMMASDYSFNSGNDEYYVEAVSTPAQLKNADASYVETASVGAGTYTYKNGFWYPDFCVTLDRTTLTVEGEILLNQKFHIPESFFADEAMLTAQLTEQDCGIDVGEDRDWTIGKSELMYLSAGGTALTEWGPEGAKEYGQIALDEKGRYVLSQGIAAGEMTGKVTVAFKSGDSVIQIYDRYNGGSPKDSVTRTAFEFAGFAFTAAEQTDASEKTKKLGEMCQAMLTFGEYAQAFYGIDAEGYELLENKEFTRVSESANITKDSVTATFNVPDTVKALLSVDSIMLDLDSTIDLRIYFTPLKPDSIPTFKLIRPVDNGNDTKEEDLQYTIEGSTYYLDIVNVPPAYWNDTYKIVVNDENDPIECSVFDWVKLCLSQTSGNTHEQDMARAMYYYCEYAEDYFEAKRAAEAT